MAEDSIAIREPFPVPAVSTTLVEKSSASQPIGIAYNNKDEATVVVTRVKPDSLLRDTHVREGMEILAINGEAIHTAKQATSILKDNVKLEFTIIDPTHVAREHSPFCYIEVAPTSKLNPGLSFESCRNRTMVTVSEIFLNDLSQTRLRLGDIVLAVNGVSVWKPEQAEAEQLKAAREGQALVLYCVDVDRLLDHMVSITPTVRVVGGKPIQMGPEIVKKGRGHYRIQEGTCLFQTSINHREMTFDNDTEWENRLKTTGGERTSKFLRKKDSYIRCLGTFKRLNEGLERQMLVLKCKVAAHAWYHSVNDDRDKNTSSGSDTLTYVVPSAPMLAMQGASARALPMATAFLVDELCSEDEYETCSL